MSQSYDDFGFEPLDTLCRIWHGDEEMTDEAQKGLDLYAAAHCLAGSVQSGGRGMGIRQSGRGRQNVPAGPRHRRQFAPALAGLPARRLDRAVSGRAR